MQRTLHALYSAAMILAALCMIGVLLCVIASIVSRQFHFYIPGLDAYAGYFMAAAGFLALASTFRHGEHIRVTLVLNTLSPKNYLRLDVAALIVSCVLTIVIAFFCIKLVVDSYQFNDISTGNDATPLWIPQLAMAAGAVLFAVACIEATVATWRGKTWLIAKKPEDSSHE
jgi:TRAP-type C4-dicarboxylate transport system permease small subunit